jgi:hypothetical protein
MPSPWRARDVDLETQRLPSSNRRAGPAGLDDLYGWVEQQFACETIDWHMGEKKSKSYWS